MNVTLSSIKMYNKVGDDGKPVPKSATVQFRYSGTDLYDSRSDNERSEHLVQSVDLSTVLDVDQAENEAERLARGKLSDGLRELSKDDDQFEIKELSRSPWGSSWDVRLAVGRKTRRYSMLITVQDNDQDNPKTPSAVRGEAVRMAQAELEELATAAQATPRLEWDGNKAAG